MQRAGRVVAVRVCCAGTAVCKAPLLRQQPTPLQLMTLKQQYEEFALYVSGGCVCSVRSGAELAVNPLPLQPIAALPAVAQITEVGMEELVRRAALTANPSIA